MTDYNEKEFLSIQEAADILSVSERTVFNWIKSGKLKAEKRDGRTFIKAEDVFSFGKKAGGSYDPERHVLIDRAAFDGIMKELQASRQWLAMLGYKMRQLEDEKEELENEKVLLLEDLRSKEQEDKRPWWRRLFR